MQKIDDDFLVSLGLGSMSQSDREAFLDEVRGELKSRIGEELSKTLTDDQLEQFDELVKAEDRTAALRWLEQHCPSYEEVVASEIEHVRQEILLRKESLMSNRAAA